MNECGALKLNVSSATDKLLALGYEYANEFGAKLQFNRNISIGEGWFEYADDRSFTVNIGIKPFSNIFLQKYKSVMDLDFTVMGVTMFHELAHCEKMFDKTTSKEILISDLSKHGNPEYYQTMHHQFPHEIDAEFTGVMSMWNVLDNDYPSASSKLMFDYFKYRTFCGQRMRKLYMIEKPTIESFSKKQIEKMFDAAYDIALDNRRRLPNRFLRYGDEISRIFTTDNGYGVRPEYVSIYTKLSRAETGRETDRMTASLVSYLHPELQSKYRGLDFDALQPEIVFEELMPETTDEIKYRLKRGLENDFTVQVEQLSKLFGDTLEH